MLAPGELSERLRLKGEDWAEKHAAAELLEEVKKILLAQLALKSEGKSQAEKEKHAMSSSEYREHIESMVEARKLANRAKVGWESAKMYCELQRSKEASERNAYK